VPGPAFALGFGRLGAFPKPRRATVLWVGVEEGAREIRALAAEVEAAARRAGFAAEEKAFSPHLTLSRIQPPQDVSSLIERVSAFESRARFPMSMPSPLNAIGVASHTASLREYLDMAGPPARNSAQTASARNFFDTETAHRPTSSVDTKPSKGGEWLGSGASRAEGPS
jgi:hypothetical protein